MESKVSRMPKKSGTAPCGSAEGRARFRTAQAYLEVAKSVLDERDRDEYLNVAAGLAVLSGIAASDAICCIRLGCRHRGDDHRSVLSCCALRHQTALNRRRRS